MSERKILIPVDGSKPADKAFQWYVENLKRDRDVVVLVHIPEYHVSIGLPGRAADVDAITKGMKEENDRIENMIGKYMEELKKISVRGYKLVPAGESKQPGEAIIRAVEEEGVKNVVMGSRGLGKVRRTFMGSVSDYVTQHAPPHVSVTIIRDS